MNTHRSIFVSLTALLLANFTTPAATYPDMVQADHPIAYYRFSDVLPVATNSGSLGATANGVYNGNASVGAEAPRPPDFVGFEADNTALQLDGTDDFVGTLSGLLNNHPVFTISGWIRRGADQPDRTGLWGQNDLFEFGYINNNTLQAWTDGALDVTPNPIPNGQWAHLAIVNDGSPGLITMYVNGLAVGSRSNTLPMNNTFAFNIGGGGVFDGTGNFFTGQIDEVAVFDQALGAERIAAHYYSTVNNPPLITHQPQGTNVFEGADVTLRVQAVGTPPLTYQWLDFGTPIPDQTNATLVFNNITEAQGSSYQVQVKNAFGEVLSDVAEISVQPTEPPTITQEPVSITKYASAVGTLTVVATGGSHLQYQWQTNEVDVTDATNASLIFPSLQASDAGNYRVIVANAAGAVTSLVAIVTVIVPVPGSYESLIVASAPMAFWRFNESNGTIAFDSFGTNNATYMSTAMSGSEAPRPPSFPGFEPDNLAVQLDGTAGFVAGPVGLLNGLSDITVVGWIRRGGEQIDRTGLFGQNDLFEFGYINNNTLQLWTDGGLDVSPNPIPNGEWAQLAVVSDGSPGTAKMYVNGALVASRPHFLPGPNTFAFNIGGGGVFDGTGNFFNGQIDELAVFNKVLSSDQICALYNRGTSNQVTLSITGSGNIIPDVKPVGAPHDGANFGAAWFESNTDGAAVTREGVMEFVATEGDQITLAANADFDRPQGTITFWMRSAGTTGGGNFGAMLVDRRSARGDVIVQGDDGAIFVQANSGAGTVNQFSAGTVSDDRWHHIAYIYDQAASGRTTIYVDGTLAGTQTPTGAWSWDPAQRIELGRSHDGYWRAFNGSMDDFRIYNRLLSATEIAQVISGDLVDAAALKVRFNFDGPPIGVSLSWSCGTLQSTDALIDNGPGTIWTDVPNAAPPYTVNPQTAPALFYRVKY